MKPAARVAHVSVSELTIGKTAMRLLGQRLVSTEVAYVQRKLGASATQVEIDKYVLKVRKMPWASIVAPE